MDKRILVINPGSTSTKLALFQGEQKLFDAAVRHSKEDLSPFSWVMEQADFRQTAIEKELSAHNVDLTTLDAVCARGGQLPYCAAGTYLVDQDMVDFMYTVRDAAHASNLGCVLALRIARPLGIPAFICDPVTVDEMTDEARISGHPVLPRMMTGHALNCRAMALRCAETVLHKPLADCRLIVLHLGGGGSARLFIGGKMVDGVRDDEWMFAPERMGGVSLQPLVAMCYSGAYTKQDIMDLIRGKGGLMAHLGTANAQEVEQRIADGDAHAKLIYDAMAAFYMACASFMSQNYGAGKLDRMRKSYFISLAYSFGVGLLLGGGLLLFGRQFLALFTTESAVIDAGMKRIMVMGLAYCISAFMDCTIAASRGLGKTIGPTVIVILGSCVFRVIWVYTIFAHFHTIPSLYLLYPFSWLLTAAAEIVYFIFSYRKAIRIFHEREALAQL